MTFATPSEAAPLLALGVAIAIAFVPQARLAFTRGSLASFCWIASATAALLSGAYVAFYLRGGPRIVDATSYFLEARAISEGHLAWAVPEPAASVTGRFLVRDSLASASHVGVIFPPGYPLLLAVGHILRAPMIVGPALAFAATWATAALARAALPEDWTLPKRDLAVRLAVALSVFCAALRYHTADTMSHGLCACLVAASLACALAFRRAPATRPALGLGLSLGLLACTRPVTGLALLAVCGFLVAPRVDPKRGAIALAGAAPFVALFFAHQRAATGALLQSSQSLYYDVADTPRGCFRYGFGRDIGCEHEHGDFLERYMPDGFGFVQALGTTARRLAKHGMDAMNATPLALALVVALVLVLRDKRQRGLRAGAVAIVLVVLAYAPFYFDGNIPGGGARMYADVLPIEHVLVAWLAIAHAGTIRLGIERAATSMVAASVVGFSFFAHADHEALRDREGGRPMFEPSRLAAAGVERGLVFVDTDHGFSLGYSPSAAALEDIEVARHRGDALDWLLWTERGRPAAWTYDYDVATGAVKIDRYTPSVVDRIEAENLWPALAQRGASALPEHTAEGCASAGKWLVLRGEPNTSVRLALPRRLAGRRIAPVAFVRGDARAVAAIASGAEVFSSAVLDARPGCVQAPTLRAPEGAQRFDLVITLERAPAGSLVAIDALMLDLDSR